MKICFIMYPWHKIEVPLDSTLRLIHECVRRKHFVAVVTPSSLVLSHNKPHAFCHVIVPNPPLTHHIPTFHRTVTFKRKRLLLSEFDAVFMRNNPPFDPISLNFLDSIDETVFIINALRGLRVGNNKMYAASLSTLLPKQIPTTYISKNKRYLEKVFHTMHSSKVVLKPLNAHGGKGVVVIEKQLPHNFSALIDFYIHADLGSNYVILQEYIEGAEAGDVRVLLLNGIPIGASRRIPAPGDYRSNIHAGGSAAPYALNPKEEALCAQIGPKLVADGLYFVGLDLIEGSLLEINVLSPGGVTRINEFNGVRLQENIIDFVEQATLLKKASYVKTL